jgi:hypothetical protein
MDRRLGGPQSQSGRGDEKKNSQSLPGLEPPIIQPVAQRYTTEISQFNSSSSSKKVKLSLCLTKHHTMKMYWGVEV